MNYFADDHDDEQDGIASNSVNVTADVQTSGERQMVTLHGIILRSQLVTLLKKNIFYAETEGVRIKLV
jgi:hypothetical protein